MKTEATMTWNAEQVRADFPNLRIKVRGKPLVYFDNAATTFKPKPVIDEVVRAYSEITSNVHRGVHTLSERATHAYEEARKKVQLFIHAASQREIIFTKGTTESINLVAASYVSSHLKPGDEILITHMEHHSNIVPWQLAADRHGIQLRVLPVTHEGELALESLDPFLTEKTKLLAVTYVSNTLGTVNPLKEIIERAHAAGAVVLVDAAQAVSHQPVDVRFLDCDFLAFSGHKLFGPTGTGVLYGKEKLLDSMPPYQGGGDMIASVKFEKTIYNTLPYKFEAGTPNVAGVIGLGRAVDYLNGFSWDDIITYEDHLRDCLTKRLQEVEGLTLIGTAKHKVPLVSFTLKGIHAHDIGTLLDEDGIAVRTGHHCTQPLMDFYGVPATARASLSFYNTEEEIDRLIEGLRRVQRIFST